MDVPEGGTVLCTTINSTRRRTRRVTRGGDSQPRYYTTGAALGGCASTIGQNYPGFSTRDYGAHQQFGQLLKVAYSGANGVAPYSYEDFQNNLANNPCPR